MASQSIDEIEKDLNSAIDESQAPLASNQASTPKSSHSYKRDEKEPRIEEE